MEALRFSRPSQIGRRDLRSGRATATATRTPAGVTVRMTWSEPLAGTLTEEYSLQPGGNTLHVVSSVQVRRRRRRRREQCAIGCAACCALAALPARQGRLHQPAVSQLPRPSASERAERSGRCRATQVGGASASALLVYRRSGLTRAQLLEDSRRRNNSLQDVMARQGERA
jgi:hypothetical protein